MMDRDIAKAFRDRWQAVAAIEAEEQRLASDDLRWRQLKAILQLAAELGLACEKPPEEVERARQRWVTLKERLA